MLCAIDGAPDEGRLVLSFNVGTAVPSPCVCVLCVGDSDGVTMVGANVGCSVRRQLSGGSDESVHTCS